LRDDDCVSTTTSVGGSRNCPDIETLTINFVDRSLARATGLLALVEN
jgi:hypothetical protein